MWSLVKSYLDSVWEFIKEFIFGTLSLMKWCELVPVILIFTRLIRWDGDAEIVPMYQEYGYTYYALSYFMQTRIIEMFLFYCVYYRTGMLFFLLLSLFGWGKIADELIDAFHYSNGEMWWQIASLIITYIIYLWTQNQKKKQLD